VHRNTFLRAPLLLDSTFQLKTSPGIYFAGQISGVEGYVESAASGLLVRAFIAERLAGREPELPPPTTALGGLVAQLSRHPERLPALEHHLFAHSPRTNGAALKKRAKYEVMAERALADLGAWLASTPAPESPSGVVAAHASEGGFAPRGERRDRTGTPRFGEIWPFAEVLGELGRTYLSGTPLPRFESSGHRGRL
jgi:hypothetical protein